MKENMTKAPAAKRGRQVAKRREKRKKRRINRLRVTIFLFIVILAVAGSIALLVLKSPSFKPVSGDTSSRSQAVFGVKTITVTGCTHYTDDQIIETSGIYNGQSVFAVNKRKAAEKILQAFPYVQKVTVDSPSFNVIKISIQEEEPVGIVATDNGWFVMGRSGKGLEFLPADSDRVGGYFKIKGTVLEDGGVGHMLLDDRSLSILDSLFSAFDTYGLQNVDEIDVTDYTNISLDWNGQITVLLGNDTNLDHEISVTVTTLNRVLQSYGENARGKLDLSTYSDSDTSNDWTVFTPEDLLTEKTK